MAIVYGLGIIIALIDLARFPSMSAAVLLIVCGIGIATSISQAK